MTNPTFESCEGSYAALLGSMQIRPNRQPAFDTAARKIVSHKDRYLKIEKATGVPWWFIGLLHYRESDCDFNTHLHNGDSLRRRTYHVPAGRPLHGSPPFTFEESAIDALQQKGYDKETDWSDEHICYRLEVFNGMGYRMYHPNVPSPYLWGGTNHYVAGKYTSDGHFDSSHVDTQLGTVPLMMTIRKMANVKPRDIVVSSSRKLSTLRKIRQSIVLTFGGIFGADWMGVSISYLNQIKEFANDHKIMLMLGAAGVTWLIFKLLENWSLEDHQNGSYTPSGLSSNTQESQ